MIGKKKISDNSEKNLQIQILGNFLEYQRQSKYLQKMIRVTSPDTRGVMKNINSLEYSLGEKKDVLITEEFFGNVDKVFEDSFIGAFQRVVDTTSKTYSNLTITQNPNAKPVLDRMKKDIGTAWAREGKRAKAEKARKAVDTEFLRYVLMVANKSGTALGINLSNNYFNLFEKSNPENIVRKLQNIKRDKGNLKENLIVKELLPILDRESQDNIKMFNTRISAREENLYTQAFYEIQEQDPGFARSLAILSLIQSGKESSPISFTKIIPNELYIELTEEALTSLEEEGYVPDMGRFEDQFYRNNIQLVPEIPRRRRN